MKPIKFTNLMILGLVVTMAACGCKKNPTGVTPLPGARTKNIGDTGPRGPMASNPGPGTGLMPDGTASGGDSKIKDMSLPTAGSFDNYTPDTAALKDFTIYFAFDSSAINGSEKTKLSSVADYLKSHAGDAVRIAGNCDERGTEEYNRALGERRALAAREELVNLGVSPSMIDTISYGKDKPEDPGHDENAWSKNRRDDFILLIPPGAKP